MKRLQLFILTAIAISLSASGSYAHGPRSSWHFGFHYGFPSYCRPWYPYYYRPYPLYVESFPTPVVVRPAPVIVRQSPIIVQESSPVGAHPVTTASGSWVMTSDTALQQLTHPDENVRRDAAMELGRTKAERAVDSLAATLAGDRSPIVRDAAARALGLVASPRALPALTHAAQADTDRDVRRSAQFAIEVIQSQMRR